MGGCRRYGNTKPYATNYCCVAVPHRQYGWNRRLANLGLHSLTSTDKVQSKKNRGLMGKGAFNLLLNFVRH